MLPELEELPDLQLDRDQLMAIDDTIDDNMFDNYVSELGARAAVGEQPNAAGDLLGGCLAALPASWSL